MDDFLSFANQKRTNEEAASADAANLEAEAKRLAAKYDGKNEVVLLRDIYARAEAGKRDGTLTNEQIDAFYRQIEPMLDRAKKRKLQKLIAQLKSI